MSFNSCTNRWRPISHSNVVSLCLGGLGGRGGRGELADYFSNSLPGSINSDTNAPSSGGILDMFSRSHLNYFGIFSICRRLSAGPKQASQLCTLWGPNQPSLVQLDVDTIRSISPKYGKIMLELRNILSEGLRFKLQRTRR